MNYLSLGRLPQPQETHLYYVYETPNCILLNVMISRWIYVSNSEDDIGGVGAITFNSSGDVIDYQTIMTNTSTNCGGGKTYWGTWVSCEEFATGQGSYSIIHEFICCTHLLVSYHSKQFSYV